MSGSVSEQEVLNFIEQYNLEEPKKPDAKPDELILADNSVTLTTKKHFGNLVAMIAEGRWGAGKTYSALKIYHDLKSFSKVTYVPVRHATNVELRTRIRGEASLIATLIAMALVKPEDLKSNVKGALTNAKNVNINIDGELDEILKQYYLNLKQSNSRHAVILDELEIGVKTGRDAEAIVETIRILRELYDAHGSVRLMLIVFTAPIPPGSEAHSILGATLRGYISTRITGPEQMYLLGKVEFSSLDDPEVVKSVMKGFAEKSLELLEKKKNYKARVENVDDAVSLLIRTSGWLRFGVDILKHALAKAVTTSVNNEVSVDLKSYVEADIREILGLPGQATVVGVFGGKFGAVERDFDHIESLLERTLDRAKKQYSDRIVGYYKAAVRREPGFESVAFMIRAARREDKKVKETKEVKEIPLVFWLRFTDLNEKALGKANKTWGGANVIILTLEGCKHEVLTKAQKTFNIATIAYLPPEIMYFIIAGSKIRDLKIGTALDTLFTETYERSILEAIGGLV